MKQKNKSYILPITKNGKVIFITGGATGIGLATTKLLLAQGHCVTIFSRTKPEKKDLEILSHISRVCIIQGDITKQKDITRALIQTSQTFGRLDVLINNAGVSQKKLFKDTTPNEWDAIINVNIKGTLRMTHAALPYLKKGGHIINIASGSALHAVSHLSIYSLSKAAILNFTQSLDTEIKKDGIRAIVITPGSTQTALFEKASPGKNPLYKPEDIALVIANTISGKQKPDTQRIVNPFKHLYA